MSNSLRLAYYGDDFTGSTDVMEVLQWSGLRTVLFLAPPTREQLASFPDLQAFGVAGWSRNMSPQEMQQELPAILEALRESGAPLIHYKVCSTFDSSPAIGSIGKALEIGQSVLRNRPVPIVVGAPNLGRYQVFGNLFARSGLDTEPFRLDRHPTMSQHPITPMSEADLRLVLAEQTTSSVGLVDILQLHGQSPVEIVNSIRKSDWQAVLLDLLQPDDLAKVGSTIEQLCAGPSSFIVGSSGVEYALTEHWRQSGELKSTSDRHLSPTAIPPVRQLLVFTGSCSPVNARQIAWAEKSGFETMPIDMASLVVSSQVDRQIDQLVDQAASRLDTGVNLILHSSLGPSDPRVAETHAALRSIGLSDADIKLKSSRILGPLLGRIAMQLLTARPMPRVGIAGGDTSGNVARALHIQALEAIAPLAPGSPLCRIHSQNMLNGVEIIFKGGQVGREDVWGRLLHGG